MRTLIFGTLKVLEVFTFFLLCKMLSFLFAYIGVMQWIVSIINKLSTSWTIVLVIIWLILIIVWFIAIFDDWISKNWTWTDRIICSFKKLGQK